MATLTIRNIDPEVHKRLRVRAAHNGRSMEAELRDILKNAVSGDAEHEKAEEVNLAEGSDGFLPPLAALS
jgi:plasmid stability protein